LFDRVFDEVGLVCSGWASEQEEGHSPGAAPGTDGYPNIIAASDRGVVAVLLS